MTREPAEVIAFFVALLGVGFILDADCGWGGGAMIVAAGALFGAARWWNPHGC